MQGAVPEMLKYIARKLFMRMRDIFAMAGQIVNGEATGAYWVKNEDGTISIMVRLPGGNGNGERSAEVLERVSRVVREISDKVSNGGNGCVCNSFLGSNVGEKLEAVGMATLEGNEETEKNLCMMNIMQVG